MRAQVLAIKEQEYIEAARASGASGPWIVWRHVLPNCVGPIVVNATLAVAAAIIAESALSFLGFGVQLPATSWGRMLADARATSAPPRPTSSTSRGSPSSSPSSR